MPLLQFKRFLNEKSVSKSQQRLMGMALAYKRGELDSASDEVKKLAKSMSTKDLQDFAKTKHDNLPEDDDPCWDGYTQRGTKKKNGKTVPNCVPEETVDEAARKSWVVFSPKAAKSNQIIKRFKDKEDAQQYKEKIKKHFPENMPLEVRNLNEEIDEANARTLSIQQRRKAARILRRRKGRIKIARKRALRRTANTKTLDKRSKRSVRQSLFKKFSRGKGKQDVSMSRRSGIEKRINRLSPQRIKALALRQRRKTRSLDRARRSSR